MSGAATLMAPSPNLVGEQGSNADPANTVGQVMPELVDRHTRWAVIDALCGSTRAMRAQSRTLLPEQPREEPDEYSFRLGNSFLFEALKGVIDRLVEKPFQRDLQVSGVWPANLAYLESNVDREGTSLEGFAKCLLRNAWKHGQVHVIPDRPPRPTGATAAFDRSASTRPYLSIVRPTSLIGFRWDRTQDGRIERDEDGSKRLEQVRFRNSQIEPDGRFGTQRRDYVRVLFADHVEIWRKKRDKSVLGLGPTKEEFELVSEYGHEFGRVPWLSYYVDPDSTPMLADPPLQGIADLNIAHWVSASDQRNAVRYARWVMLFGKKLGGSIPGADGEVETEIAIGPGRLTESDDADADLRIVEPTGAAVALGQDEIEKLEERMERLGVQPLMRRGANTATGQAIDESNSMSRAQAAAKGLGRFLRDCVAAAGEYLGQELPEDFAIDVFSDFGVDVDGANDMQALAAMRSTSDISQETYLREAQRRSLLDPKLDIEDEIGRTEAEGPAPGLITQDQPEAFDDEESDNEV